MTQYALVWVAALFTVGAVVEAIDEHWLFACCAAAVSVVFWSWVLV